MKKYKKPIYYIGTQIASNLMTIRVYVEEYNELHKYDYMVCSFDKLDIIKRFDAIKNQVCAIYDSPVNHNEALARLKDFDPNFPIEK
ncbi:MAG: hypothetical protein J6L01_05130 [Alistipes sp.]|nr:hypothetical protein [Alistipes sp.]